MGTVDSATGTTTPPGGCNTSDTTPQPDTNTGPCCYHPRVQLAAELIGRRWTASIIMALAELDHARFGEIRAQIPGLSDRLLADRLEELAGFGVVTRCPDGSGYGITDMGRELKPILTALGEWSRQWCGEPGPNPGRRAR